MNKNRRAKLFEALGYLRAAERIVEDALEEEEDCLNNLPDGISDSERYEKMESAAGSLSSAADSIGEAIESIEEARA